MELTNKNKKPNHAHSGLIAAIGDGTHKVGVQRICEHFGYTRAAVSYYRKNGIPRLQYDSLRAKFKKAFLKWEAEQIQGNDKPVCGFTGN